jgi:GNAT superfamily N-acetyltransferase
MEVRLIKEGEGELCNDFHNRIYKTDRTIKQWRWEFIENNYDGTPIPYVVVEDQGKIVGTQAFIPIRMIDEKGVYWTAKSEETLVDPDYRGMRLFERMYEILFKYAEEHGFSYIWGFTPATKAFARLNFTFPARTEQIFMPFSSRSILPMLDKYKNYKPEGLGNRLKTAFYKTGTVLAGAVSAVKVAVNKRTIPMNCKIRTLEEPDEQCEDICRRFIHHWGGTTIFRNKEYIRWRLFNNPYARSIVKALYNDDRLLGWTAFTIGEDGLGYLVDLMVPGDDSEYLTEDLIKTLLLEAVIGTRNMGATAIRGWRVNNHPFDRLICDTAKKIGLYHIRKGHAVVLYNCPNGEKRLSYGRFDDWFISRIYTEGTVG